MRAVTSRPLRTRGDIAYLWTFEADSSGLTRTPAGGVGSDLVPLSLGKSQNLPQYAELSCCLRCERNAANVMWSSLRGGRMRFDRCAGGHNFDFDTDVCTRCGIDRRQYRGGGNPECAPRPMTSIVATIHIGSAHLEPTSRRAFGAGDPFDSQPSANSVMSWKN